VSLYKGTASLETPGERPESLSITLTQGSSGSEFRVSTPSTISAPYMGRGFWSSSEILIISDTYGPP
jgi:hypothetical protein